MRQLVWVAAMAMVTGCGFEPDAAMPMAARPEYAEWWSRTEACSDRQGDFTKIEFFVVPGEEFNCPTGQCVGRWQSGHKIYLSEAWAANELVVRHEMLHELLGHSGHPNPPFGTGCPLTWDAWRGAHPSIAMVPDHPVD